MSRFIIIIILISFGFYDCKSQNLISNGSFENTTSIDCNLAINFYTLNDWQFLYNTSTNSPDYYTSVCPLSSNTSEPSNCVGFQNPKDGNAYVGAIFYHIAGGDLSEYLTSNLTQTLKKNYKYCFSYYLSLSDNSKYACKNIGAVFTPTIPLINSFTSLINDTPQVVNTSIITDKINWTKISGSFVAKGGEKFITIGRFRHVTASDFQTISPTSPATLCINFSNAAYYYIDSVSLYACDSIIAPPDTAKPPQLEQALNIPNVFTPNSDGINDVFSFSLGLGNTLNSFNIYNRWGNVIHQTTNIQTQTTILWDGRTTSGEPCKEGVYFYTLEYVDKNGDKQKRNGYITLIK